MSAKTVTYILFISLLCYNTCARAVSKEYLDYSKGGIKMRDYGLRFFSFFLSFLLVVSLVRPVSVWAATIRYNVPFVTQPTNEACFITSVSMSLQYLKSIKPNLLKGQYDVWSIYKRIGRTWMMPADARAVLYASKDGKNDDYHNPRIIVFDDKNTNRKNRSQWENIGELHSWLHMGYPVVVYASIYRCSYNGITSVCYDSIAKQYKLVSDVHSHAFVVVGSNMYGGGDAEYRSYKPDTMIPSMAQLFSSETWREKVKDYNKKTFYSTDTYGKNFFIHDPAKTSFIVFTDNLYHVPLYMPSEYWNPSDVPLNLKKYAGYFSFIRRMVFYGAK